MRWNPIGRTSSLLLVLAVCSLSVAGCGRDGRFAEGQAAYQAKDFTKAASLFERACRDGEARACTSLGSMALKGETGKVDVSWARGLYEKACQGGDAEGCGNLRAMTAQAVGPAPQVTQATPPATDATPPAAETAPPVAEATPEAAFVPTAHPSFDCATARNQAERLICTDDELARRDVELAHLYRRARDHAAEESVVISEQRDWIALSRNVCASKECLYRAYRHRARDLEDWIP